MIDKRIIITVVILVVALIIMDEFVYAVWKKLNPGTKYTSITDQTAPLVDPGRPPSMYYQ